MTTPTTAKTRSQIEADNVVALLRARNSLLWIKTPEEARVERHLFEAAASAKYIAHTWDVAQGICDMAGKVEKGIVPSLDPDAPRDPSTDPDSTLDAIKTRAEAYETFLADKEAAKILPDAEFEGERGVWIMRDLPTWLAGPGGETTKRRLRNLARQLSRTPIPSAQAIIVLAASGEVPAELKSHATVIEWPLPDRAEIAAMVDQLAARYSLELNGQREAAIEAAVGLTGEQAQSCYSKSIVQTKTIDPAVVALEKKRVIASEGMIEWYDPLPGGLSVVGGLDNLKGWFGLRKIAFSLKARVYGLPRPNGVLLVGVSGCAKSYIAKQLGGEWQMPVLRIDLGALKSMFVGKSEENLRKTFSVIEAIGRCVVWFDEIEKALAGATNGGADGGVSADALGAILTWMQERKGEAFVIATANDISGLPPEFLRKGRFDEIFFVDLPTMAERVAILNATLKKHGRDKLPIDASKVAAACERDGCAYTGAEIAAIVPDAMFTAFADGEREITTADLIDAASTVVPLAKTAKEKIERLRKWGRESAKSATVGINSLNMAAPAKAAARPDGRVLDLDSVA